MIPTETSVTFESPDRVFDGLGHTDGQRNGSHAVFTGDDRRSAVAHALQERLELRAQRLFFRDRHRRRRDRAIAEAIALHFLLFRIDGVIEIAAEETLLAHALLRHAAGGEI